MQRARSRPTRQTALSPKFRDQLERIERARESMATALQSVAGSKISDEEIIAKLTDAGCTADQLARVKAGMEGRTLSAKRRELADFRRAEIARMNSEGMHDCAIANALGMSRGHVCQVRIDLKIPPVKQRP